MNIWIVLLRAIGTLVIIVGVLGRLIAIASTMTVVPTFEYYQSLSWSIIEGLALTLLCFSLAAGLKHMQRMQNYLARQNAAQRRAALAELEKRDLAPVAPNWSEDRSAPRQQLRNAQTG